MKQIEKVAIITARGGSKRIPRKNIREFLGKPIIAYAIETSLNSQLFDEVMVSTEDPEIAEISKKYGANIPFMRSLKTADDFSGTADVLLEVIKEYNKRKIYPKYGCCIYPTAVFITKELIKKGFDLMINRNFDVVFPVAKFSFTPYRALKIINDSVIPVWEQYYNMRSQDIEPAYHDTGQFYWFQVERFLSKKSLITENTGVIVVPEFSFHDIDTDEDWEIAEIKYKIIKNKIFPINP